MEFASRHVYLGADEEAEVEIDDDLLAGVEEAQQAQQPEQEGERLECLQQRSDLLEADSMKFKKKSANSSAKPGGGFFSRLFGSSSSSGSAASAGPPPPPPAPAAPSSVMAFLSKSVGNRRRASRSRSRERACREMAEPSSVELNDAKNEAKPDLPAGAGRAASRRKPAYKRAVDTNVLAIKFSTLAKSSDDVFAGDAVVCEECSAVLSNLSTIVDHEGRPMKAPSQAEPSAAASAPIALPANVFLEAGQSLWQCDFCSHANILDGLQVAEIPTGSSRDYVLEPAPEAAAGGSDKSNEADDSYVVFCLDVSGSMCVSSAVPGRIELRGQKALDPALLALGDVDMSGVGAQARETYVSRLQAVQASIDKQLTDLAASRPNQRVMLVTFAGEVTIIGDAQQGQVVVAGDKLNQEAELKRIGSEYAEGRPVSQSQKALGEALFALEESGPTALGPALIVAMAMASRKRGSQVIVCTDGVANVGLGSIDTKGGVEGEVAAEAWYRRQGEVARDAGITVNIMSIKGDECRLELLGLVADQTEGQVVRVDPMDLIRNNNMGALLANPVIATNVSVTFFLHAGMMIRGEEQAMAEQEKNRKEQAQKKKQAPQPSIPEEDQEMPDVAAAAAAAAAPPAADAPPSLSTLSRIIGNVYRDSETTLEYGLRSRLELARYAHMPSLPFQAKITYTALSGMKVLRVLTQSQSVTLDRAVAEKDVKLELLSAQVASKSAALARDGRYREARMNWMSATPMLSRAAQSPQQQQVFSNYASNIDVFDRAVAQQHRKEKEAGGNSDDDCSSEAEEEAAAPSSAAAGAVGGALPPRPAAASKSKASMAMKRSKKAQQSDECYRVIHQTRQLNSAGLL